MTVAHEGEELAEPFDGGVDTLDQGLLEGFVGIPFPVLLRRFAAEAGFGGGGGGTDFW